MNHINFLVENILQSCNQEHYWKFLIMSKWNEIMGPVASKVSICKIHKNTIILGVSDSSWMQELHLLSTLIKEKINKLLESDRIEIIKLKYVGDIQKGPYKKKRTALTHEKYQLTAKEQAVLVDIKDPELSEALIGFLQKCHQYS